MAQLVTDSRFLKASPLVLRSVQPVLRAHCLSSRKNHGLGTDQDTNMGRDARDARAPRYWLLVGPSLSTPHSKGAQERLCTHRRTSLRTPRPKWAVGAFSAPYPSLPMMVHAPVYIDAELDDIEKELALLA